MITVFHELGHAMDELASSGQPWARLTGGSDEPDFMEVPSQLMEEWAWDPDVLAGFARHVDTGEPIPRELVARMREASEIGGGLATQSYLFTSAIGFELQAQIPVLIGTLASANFTPSTRRFHGSTGRIRR